MRASQVWNWIYQRGVTDVADFANISKDTRELIGQHFVVGRPEVVTAQVSTDGTRKWLLRFEDGEEAECVFIPDAYRGTLCVSSPGRLHPQLPLLPHRHDEAGPQPRPRPKSSARCCSPATRSANGRTAPAPPAGAARHRR